MLGDRLPGLSLRQTDLLDRSLGRLLDEGRPVSDAELEGKFDLITEFVSPRAHEKVQAAYHFLWNGTGQSWTPPPSDGQRPQVSLPSTETAGSGQQPPNARELGILNDSGINVQDAEALRLGLEMLRAFD